jgi:endonuclease/exonuclease/phosphatase (EEP) superfamily protein YafD
MLVLLLGLAAIGQLARDRHLVLAWCFYLPLLPLGAFAVAADLVARGRLLGRGRFALAFVGLLFIAWGVLQQAGFGDPPAVPQRPVVRVLHWNVSWGSKPWGHWDSLRDDIVGHNPDVLVLNEAPFPGTGLVEDLVRDKGWSMIRSESPEGQPYVYQLTVCSRWPVRLDHDRDVANGHVVLATVERSGRPLRILVVDVQSNPLTVPRKATTDDVVALLTEADDRGRTIDVVAGDFNTPGRSVAFDRMETTAGGYRRAGRLAPGWRATWPTYCPLYDIDHVWIHTSWPVHGCELFSNRYSDHRGHLVTLQP